MDVSCLIIFVAFLIQTINWFLMTKQARRNQQEADRWHDRYIKERWGKGGLN